MLVSIIRNNHYVPQWYQERFFIDGRRSLSYLDLAPQSFVGSDGATRTGRNRFDWPTSKMFRQRDLYSTSFGAAVSDEIERKLFGDIDSRGAVAVRAFAKANEVDWHSHFEDFFKFVDIQKLRTPKGLDWLRSQYPELSQNELMVEMQSIQMLNLGVWVTGVREIVSAEDSEVKFITTDHPVTVYNHAIRPDDAICKYPNDPSIALKGSQTIFPLGADHCLILTNLEYARDASVQPLEKRTFARNFSQAMVSTINFIRNRRLNSTQVMEINYVMKTRARRYIAAGAEDWLFPEKYVKKDWHELRNTLLPPRNGLYMFGGEIFAQFKDGSVRYQDEFGRGEKPRQFLEKELPANTPKLTGFCACGSGLQYGRCCHGKPLALRPSWKQVSIRERNLMFANALLKVLNLDDRDWLNVRQEITDEKIADVYRLYGGLWPVETELLQLLPKPDKSARALYTGCIHPKLIHQFALGSALYFGEVLIQHPFVNPAGLNKEYSPTEKPHLYRSEVLKAVIFFMGVLPLIEAGIVNLVPDPCDFDLHLRKQMIWLARARSRGLQFDPEDDPRTLNILKEDMQRMILGLPDEAIEKILAKEQPTQDPTDVAQSVALLDILRQSDPLAVLQPRVAGTGRQLNAMTVAPNFEIAMYLAQATGSHIITDSRYRELEMKAALNRRYVGAGPVLNAFAEQMNGAVLRFPREASDIIELNNQAAFVECRAVMAKAFSYLKDLKGGVEKPNLEAQLAGRLKRAVASTQKEIKSRRITCSEGRLNATLRLGGIQDNTINRLLLMSNSEHHLPFVPLASYIYE